MLFLRYTAHTRCKLFSKSMECEKAIVFTASLMRGLMMSSVLMTSTDTASQTWSSLTLFPPLANTDSHPHNLSTHPSTQYTCHTARTPLEHLVRLFFFFLIRRIPPVSNSALPLNTPLPFSACLITFCRLGQIGALEGWRGGKAMSGEGGRRVDVTREKKTGCFLKARGC